MQVDADFLVGARRVDRFVSLAEIRVPGARCVEISKKSAAPR
jgi:hypothetical protein